MLQLNSQRNITLALSYMYLGINFKVIKVLTIFLKSNILEYGITTKLDKIEMSIHKYRLLLLISNLMSLFGLIPKIKFTLKN